MELADLQYFVAAADEGSFARAAQSLSLHGSTITRRIAQFEDELGLTLFERRRTGAAHNVYLSQQMLDILIALKTCAGNSRYLLPSRYDADAPMSRETFNRVTYSVVEQAKKDGLPLGPFTVHDLRRTGSTLLNELGFNSDWIEKCLAHEDGRSSRGVYNKAEYEVQRRHMMQEWSNILDAWIAGQKYAPVLMPPSMPLLEPDPSL
jgi:integrase